MSPAYRQILSKAKICARELGVYAPVKVLFAEDDQALADALAKDLRCSARASFDVQTTPMEPAAAIVMEQCHDVYVFDAETGGAGGLEVVRAMHRAGLHFPFIVVSKEPGLHREAMGEDCMGYFQKPISGDLLAMALLDAVKNYSTRCVAGCAGETAS